MTLLGLDRLPYASTRSISEICSRRCEPVHIDPARVVPPSSGALQRGREKCVPSFLSSRHPRPSSQLGQPRSQLASIGIACKATTSARAIVNSPATRNVRLLHRAARPPARLILISRRPILISRTPLSRQFLQGSVVADAECVTSKIRWLGPLCICVRREIDQVITVAKSGIGNLPRGKLAISLVRAVAENRSTSIPSRI